MDWFKGTAGLVTGAGSGIGRECALALAAHGARVMCADINFQAAVETVGLVRGVNGVAEAVEADVSDPEQCQMMVQAAIDAFGSLRLGVNNAGITDIAASTGDYPVDIWRKILSVNLDGVFYSMKSEIPAMLGAGGGSIVNVSSILGLVGWEGACAYVSAKHGVVGLTKAAAIEYATKHIRVNCVSPGFIYTPLQVNEGIVPGDDTYRLIAAKHPMNRWGTAQEVAHGIAWLLSDWASLVTGIVMPVDGGYTAQ